MVFRFCLMFFAIACCFSGKANAEPPDMVPMMRANVCALNNLSKNIDKTFKGVGISGGSCAGGIGEQYTSLASFSGDGLAMDVAEAIDQQVIAPLAGFMTGNFPEEFLGIPLPIDGGTMCSAINDFNEIRKCTSSLGFPDLFGSNAFSLDGLLEAQLDGLDLLGSCEEVVCDYGEISDDIDKMDDDLANLELYDEALGDGPCQPPIESPFKKTYLFDGTEVDNGECIGKGCFFKDGACTRNI